MPEKAAATLSFLLKKQTYAELWQEREDMRQLLKAKMNVDLLLNKPDFSQVSNSELVARDRY